MTKVIDVVIAETEARINQEIVECERIEAECCKPFPPHDDMAVYARYVLDRCKGGKYESGVMSKAMERKFELQEQLRDLVQLKIDVSRVRR